MRWLGAFVLLDLISIAQHRGDVGAGRLHSRLVGDDDMGGQALGIGPGRMIVRAIRAPSRHGHDLHPLLAPFAQVVAGTAVLPGFVADGSLRASSSRRCASA